MRKLVKEFVENKTIVDKAKKIKKEHDGQEIRICSTGKQSYDNNSQTLYYYNPVTEEIREGSSYLNQNSSNYFYEEIGNIEIRYYNNYDNDYIKIERIIRPFDEDMSFADDYEEKKFNVDIETVYYEIRDKRSNYQDQLVVECINCGKKYLYSGMKINNGVYQNLLEQGKKIICSNCTEQQNIGEFLNNIEDDRQKEKYKNYLFDYVNLDEDNLLFAE